MSNAANWFNQNVGKEYEVDLTLGAYRELLRAVFCETYRKLTNGGRLCINVANVGRKPYIPLHSIRSAVAVPPVFVAQQLNRFYVGYDTEPRYIELYEARLKQISFF